MANRIVQSIYDLRDLISGKLIKINEALRGNRTESDKTTETVDRNNKRLSDSFRKSADTIGSIRKGFQSFRDGVNEAGSALLKITGIAGLVSSALGAISIGRLFGGAVDSARDFEAVLSEVRAVSGATTEQLGRMRAASISASEATTFTATEAAGALGELARASGDADAAIAQLPATLNLAQAAGLDASEAATILTTSLNQFGEGADQASRFADLFTREANSTSDSVQSLGNALSYAAPLARQLGLSVEQTTAILGALAEQGFKGERAGTALRNVFSALLDPSSAFRAELARLNITSADFETVIQQLAAAGDDGKRALLSLDAAARPAITALVTSGGAGIRRLTEDFKNAGGEAERTAKIMGENFAGASARLTNAFTNIKTALVTPALDALAKQFDNLAQRVIAFAQTDAFAQIQKSITDFVTSSTAAIIKFVGSIDFESVAGKVRDFATAANGFFEDLAKRTETAGRIIGTVGSAISTAYNGLKAAVLGAAGAITYAFVGLSKGLLFARQALAQLQGNYAQLKPIFDEARHSIAGLEGAAKEFSNRADESSRKAGAAFEELGNRISGVKPAADKAASALKALGIQGELTKEKALELSQQFLLLPAALQRVVEPGLRAAGVFDLIAQKAPKAAGKVADAADKTVESIQKLPEAAEEMADPVENSGFVEPIQEVGEVAEETSGQMSTSFAEAANAFAAFSAQFAATSQNAAQRFRDLTWNIKEFGVAKNAIINADGSGLAKFFDAMFVAAEMVTKEIEEQREQMLASVQTMEALGDNGLAAMVSIRGGADEAAGSMRFLADEARAGRSEFDLLGSNDLGPLAEALDAAAAKVEELEQRAYAARDALAGIADSIQDEIDRIRGDDKAIEDRRHEEQLRRIEEEFEVAGQLGSSEYREAKARAEELHRLKLKQIAEERAAREEAEAAASKPTKPRPSSGTDDGEGSGSPRGGDVNVNISGDVIGGDADSLAEKIARIVKPQLDRLGRMGQ